MISLLISVSTPMAFWFYSFLAFQSHCSLVELYCGVALIVVIVSIITDGITSPSERLAKNPRVPRFFIFSHIICT